MTSTAAAPPTHTRTRTRYTSAPERHVSTNLVPLVIRAITCGSVLRLSLLVFLRVKERGKTGRSRHLCARVPCAAPPILGTSRRRTTQHFASEMEFQHGSCVSLSLLLKASLVNAPLVFPLSLSLSLPLSLSRCLSLLSSHRSALPRSLFLFLFLSLFFSLSLSLSPSLSVRSQSAAHPLALSLSRARVLSALRHAHAARHVPALAAAAAMMAAMTDLDVDVDCAACSRCTSGAGPRHGGNVC